jgi:hypothetical protein
MQNTHTASSPLFLSAWQVEMMLVEKGQAVRLWEKGQVVPNAIGAGMLAGGGAVLAAASSVAAWSSQQDLHPHVLHVYDSLSSKKAFSHHCPRGAHSFWSYLI